MHPDFTTEWNEMERAPIVRRIHPRIVWSDGVAGIEVGSPDGSDRRLFDVPCDVIDPPTDRMAAAILGVRLALREGWAA